MARTALFDPREAYSPLLVIFQPTKMWSASHATSSPLYKLADFRDYISSPFATRTLSITHRIRSSQDKNINMHPDAVLYGVLPAFLSELLLTLFQLATELSPIILTLILSLSLLIVVIRHYPRLHDFGIVIADFCLWISYPLIWTVQKLVAFAVFIVCGVVRLRSWGRKRDAIAEATPSMAVHPSTTDTAHETTQEVEVVCSVDSQAFDSDSHCTSDSEDDSVSELEQLKQENAKLSKRVSDLQAKLSSTKSENASLNADLTLILRNNESKDVTSFFEHQIEERARLEVLQERTAEIDRLKPMLTQKVLEQARVEFEVRNYCRYK
jgi:hypothetical protein